MDTQPTRRSKNNSTVLEQKGNQMSDKIKRYVAYTRVSTKEQGLSGLGLGSQLEAIKSAISSMGGTDIDKEYSQLSIILSWLLSFIRVFNYRANPPNSTRQDYNKNQTRNHQTTIQDYETTL